MTGSLMSGAFVALILPAVELENASAGNRPRVTSMATMNSTTRPLMLDARKQKLKYIVTFCVG